MVNRDSLKLSSFFTISLSSFIIILAVNTISPAISQNSFKTYESQELGFRVTTPNNWFISSWAPHNASLFPGELGEIVIDPTAPEMRTIGNEGGMTIYVTDSPSKESSMYKFFTGMWHYAATKAAENNLNNTSVIENDTSILGGAPAEKLSISSGSSDTKTFVVWVPGTDKGYSIFATTTELEDVPIIEKMLESFEFVK